MTIRNESCDLLRSSWPHAQRWVLWICGAILLLFQACASTPTPRIPRTTGKQPVPYRVDGTWYKPIAEARGYSEHGVASWYGKEFHGRKTSSGEIYDMYAMTAAHKTLPFGTWVRVRRLDTDHQVVVRINDRGPFVHGRMIDLSYTAADALGIVDTGTTKVELIALGEQRNTTSGYAYIPVDYYSGEFTFQVGAFSSQDNAERLRTRLERSFTNAHVVLYDRGDAVFYRVRVGSCKDLESAERYERYLAEHGFPDAFIVAD